MTENREEHTASGKYDAREFADRFIEENRELFDKLAPE